MISIIDLYELFIHHPQVTTDSRHCPAGSIFFALRGDTFDGNQFAEKALAAGCAYAVIDNHGIGYMINISLYAYERLQQAAEAKLYIYEALREDAHQLFGFIDKRERELFLLLISVSGVGPNTARMILSAMSPNELSAAIASGNDVSLKAVKGIGAKTAQRCYVIIQNALQQRGI